MGVAAIVVGVAYFEKLAIDNQWISATTRVIQGGVAGLLLVAGGLQFVRKGYRLYGQIVSGCGVAILYVSTYAAFNFYQLIAQPIAFALMLAVTMLAIVAGESAAIAGACARRGVWRIRHAVPAARVHRC